MSRNVSDKDVLNLRNLFKKVNPKTLDESKRSSFVKATRESLTQAGRQDLSDDQIVEMTTIAFTVANNSNDDEWIAFVRKGTLPAILPLTHEQMEVARGGGAGVGILALIAGGLAIIEMADRVVYKLAYDGKI